MDDKPEPMRDLKPAELVNNAVDQFNSDHQAGYEARGKPSRDLVQMVDKHNQTYPKLRGELEKRCDDTIVKVVRNSNRVEFDRRCNACLKLNKLQQLQRMNIKPKCGAVTRKKTTRPKDRRKRVEKKVKKRRTNDKRRIKSKVFSGCQCYYVPARNKKVTAGMNANVNMVDSNCNIVDIYKTKEGTQSQNESRHTIDNKSKDTTLTIRSSGYAGSSIPSLSSYHSYNSMDHEPMV